MNEKVYKEAEGMNDMTENEMEFRVEKDSIGTKDVPENVYYGVQSLRAAENFHITGLNMHHAVPQHVHDVQRRPVRTAVLHRLNHRHRHSTQPHRRHLQRLPHRHRGLRGNCRSRRLN